jgi:hypothetical protein
MASDRTKKFNLSYRPWLLTTGKIANSCGKKGPKNKGNYLRKGQSVIPMGGPKWRIQKNRLDGRHMAMRLLEIFLDIDVMSGNTTFIGLSPYYHLQKMKCNESRASFRLPI